jgi:hypothetical protein
MLLIFSGVSSRLVSLQFNCGQAMDDKLDFEISLSHLQVSFESLMALETPFSIFTLDLFKSAGHRITNLILGDGSWPIEEVVVRKLAAILNFFWPKVLDFYLKHLGIIYFALEHLDTSSRSVG